MKIKVGDKFDSGFSDGSVCRVLGNRRWNVECGDWVWDVRNQDGVIIVITEAALRQYLASSR